MNEKGYSNMYRFSLYQENVLLGEKVFDADQFNPITRYSINIRDILPRAITKLQKTLSKRNYDTIMDVGKVNQDNDDSYEYSLYEHHQSIINSYPKEYREGMKYNPTPILQQIDEKTIRGVACKMGLYINDKPIVERIFYVDGFNPIARWSTDLIYSIIDIADVIFKQIKRSDVKNMWDDYDLINIRGMSINQIRELSFPEREKMIYELRFN